MDNYQIKKNVINKIRENLASNPITLGSLEIDYLFRRYDRKKENHNYIEIFFEDYYYKEGAKEHYIYIDIDCYAKNEIMAIRIANEVKKRLDNIVLDEGIRLVNCRFDLQVVKLDARKYVQRVKADLTFYECQRS
jgi:hypothetical protein